jgi:hypothetical protein
MTANSLCSARARLQSLRIGIDPARLGSKWRFATHSCRPRSSAAPPLGGATGRSIRQYGLRLLHLDVAREIGLNVRDAAV